MKCPVCGSTQTSLHPLYERHRCHRCDSRWYTSTAKDKTLLSRFDKKEKQSFPCIEDLLWFWQGSKAPKEAV